MPTYEEVLNLAQRLPLDDQSRLLNALQTIVDQGVEVEGTDERVSLEELAESEIAWQSYRSGEDRGISAQELKRQLLGDPLE